MDPKAGLPAAPPPYPATYGAPQQGPTYVVQQQPTVIIAGSQFGPDPCQMQCRYCSHDMFTRVTPVPGLMAWIFSGLCCVFGCWLGCCLIPFCVQDCLDVEHRCSHCNQLLGTYQRKL